MAETSVENGVIDQPSPYSVAETLDRLAVIVTGKNMRVFARIDQRAAAEAVGLVMRPMQLLIFGNPLTGTPLMEAYPSLALDLPLKALAWEAEDGQVWLSYNDPVYLAQRHGLNGDPFQAISTVMQNAVLPQA
jgi:uncharacterized protein (DUF302 family)